MSKKVVTSLLFLIIILAGILRFWGLAKVPPSPDWDEAAFGYDAYSITLTGRDEFGKFLPVVLRSFDDYKPAFYAYVVIPSELLFGVNTYAVRFPSAVFGTLTVLAVFFLVLELFKKKSLALLSSLLMAISPWSIQFSRLGFETNTGVFFNTLMALFFLKGLKRPWFLLLATFFAGLAIYVYQSEKVFTPLLLLCLVIVYWKDLFKVPKKYLALGVIIGVIVVSPMVYDILTNPNVLLRIQGTSAFADQTTFLQQDVSRLSWDNAHHDYLGLILDNRRFIYAKTVVAHYLTHYDFNWLFIQGDIDRHHAPGMGIMYLWSAPFLLIGLYLLLFRKFPLDTSKKTRNILFLWYLSAAVPASITSGVPHAVRTENFLPAIEILDAIGVAGFLYWLFEKKLQKWIAYTVLGVIGLCFLFNVAYYLDQYFAQTNYYTSYDWQYGYQQAVSYVQSVQGKYKQIVVSEKPNLDKSYMFFLFYLKYPPSEYQTIGQYSSGGFAVDHHFGKYIFRPLNWDQDSKLSDTLFVGNPDEFPPHPSGLVKTVYDVNGSPALEIVAN